MRKSACFLDFDDSFTFNLVQEIEELGLEVELRNWRDFETLPSTDLLVLGPGPGHPDDYQILYPLLRSWIEAQRPLFGVCLGHQIFWRVMGAAVGRSKNPIHGQRIELALTPQWERWCNQGPSPTVQRYNSLCVPEVAALSFPELTCLVQDGEVMATRGSRLLTYQFHPESVGTTYPRGWVSKILEILV